MNKVNAVVVICETSRIQILQHYIVDFEKLNVIYPGIDTEYFNTTKNNYDKKVKLEENSVLTMSRLVPAKGIDRVIDALNLIKNKVNLHLYIGGGGPDDEFKSEEERNTETQLRDHISRLKLQDRVTFLGYIDHDTLLPAYYRATDTFVLGGRYEPFGLTTLEAMACGTVPIVSSVAGSKEVIVDGLNGFIIDTHNRKQLSELLLKLMTDAKLRKKISENAAFTIKEHYSWEKIAGKVINLYKSLL
jgi:mannosylfructose-phosphate synthase